MYLFNYITQILFCLQQSNKKETAILDSLFIHLVIYICYDSVSTETGVVVGKPDAITCLPDELIVYCFVNIVEPLFIYILFLSLLSKHYIKTLINFLYL